MKKVFVFGCALIALTLACCVCVQTGARADTITVECSCGVTLDLLNLPPGHRFLEPIELICETEVSYSIISEIGGVHQIDGAFIVPHDFSDEWEVSAAGHWHACMRPDCDGKSEIIGHTPASADCTDDKYCNECEYLIATGAPHDFDTAWSSDDMRHWRECKNAGCTAISDDEEHSASAAATCISPQICETCTRTLATAPHTFGNLYAYDESTHWRVCTIPGCDGAEEAAAHTDVGMWDYDDTNHWRECAANCGNKYELAAHDFSGDWLSDEEEHWHPCQQAGCGARGDNTVHVFADTWLSDEGEHWLPCEQEGCNARGENSEHAFADTLLNDEEGHWHTCKQEGCTARINYAAHSFSAAWLSDADGHWHACEQAGCAARSESAAHEIRAPGEDCTEALTCGICELPFEAAEAHTPGEWQSDAEGHWLECTVNGCAYVGEPEAHVPTPPLCKEDMSCSVCLYKIGPTTEHTWGSAWKSNKNGHWRVCAVEGCGGKEAAKAHSPGSAASCTVAQLCSTCHRALTEALGHIAGDAWFISESAGTHYQLCTREGCGAWLNSEAHDWGDWESVGEIYHARTCAVCEEIEAALHQFDNADDLDCDICGYVEGAESAPISLADALAGTAPEASVAARVMDRLLSALCPYAYAIKTDTEGVYRLFLITNGTDTALCFCFSQEFDWNFLSLNGTVLIEAHMLGANYVAVCQPGGARIAPRPEDNMVPGGGLAWTDMNLSGWYLADIEAALLPYLESLVASEAIAQAEALGINMLPAGDVDLSGRTGATFIATSATENITGTYSGAQPFSLIFAPGYSGKQNFTIASDNAMIFASYGAQLDGYINIVGESALITCCDIEKLVGVYALESLSPGGTSEEQSEIKIDITGDNVIVNKHTAIRPCIVSVKGNNASITTGMAADIINYTGNDSSVSGGDGDDNIQVFGRGNTISTGNGDDVVYVGKGDSTGGNTIYSNAGEDIVCVEGDRSRIFGGTGKSTFFIKGGGHRIIGGSKGNAFFFALPKPGTLWTLTLEAGAQEYASYINCSYYDRLPIGCTYANILSWDVIEENRKWTYSDYYIGVDFYKDFDPAYFVGKVKAEWFE